MKFRPKAVTPLMIFLAAISVQTTLFAQGTAFTYQGRLNSTDTPANGNYDFTFTLFATNSGGPAVAGPVTNAAVVVNNGLFITTVNLGDPFSGSTNWLELAVRTNGGGAFTTLAPRQQLTPVPYAITAAGLSGGISAGQITSGILSTGILAGFQGPNYVNIGGGENNTATSSYAVVGGGDGNSATGNFGVVAGGGGNTAAYSAAVGGGANNLATGYFSTIPGGANNTASGKYAFAAGQQAQALHQGAFVWADSQPAAFSSTTNDQFLIRAQNGVGINTNVTSGNALTVAGNVAATSFSGSGAGVTNVNAASLTGTISPTNIGAGTITGSMLGAGAAAANLAAGNQTAVPSGGVIMTPSGGAQEQNLLNAGYVKIGAVNLVAESWTTNLAAGPAATGELTVGRVRHTAVWTGTEMIVWGGYDALSPSYNNGEIYNPSANSWTVVNPNSGLSPRYGHTAVWTGSKMLIWGGDNGNYEPLGDGASYNPTTDSWTPITAINAPMGREGATAVWTGTNMIIWGGYTNYIEGFLYQTPIPSGGLYNPVLNSWSPMSTNGEPAECIGHTAVWTGTNMIIFGGGYDPEGLNPFTFNGGKYNPANNTWSSIASNGSPGPVISHTAIWTGTNMIVWGGLTPSYYPTNGGARYNPANNTWTAMSNVGAPEPRYAHSAVWTGTQMIIWGGGIPFDADEPVDYNDGAIYSPGANSWTALPTYAAPSIRDSHSAIWTGSGMVIWGGQNDEVLPYSNPEPGGIFYPAFNSWAAIPAAPGSGEPGPRQSATAVWTGSEMLIWGGENSGFSLQTGGQFNPAANTWTPITISNAPSARQAHTAVWTGNSMVIWGGENNGGTFNTGGRYNPASGTWTPTSLTNAPASRASHVAVWDGTEMLVWGGYESSLLTPAAGGRYNPITDTWVTMNSTNEPAPASQSAAAWTGNGMIVWGGNAGNVLGSYYTTNGGIYYPATDSWTPLSTNNAPSGRVGQTAVWSGTDFIVFGGSNGTNNLNTGARYTVSSNSWTPLPLSNAPPTLSGHCAVWTGNKMIIVGGVITNEVYNSYAELFDPVQNTWSSSLPVPEPLYFGFSNGDAVWTGSGVLIWGGLVLYQGSPPYLDQPFIYTPQQTMDLLLRP